MSVAVRLVLVVGLLVGPVPTWAVAHAAAPVRAVPPAAAGKCKKACCSPDARRPAAPSKPDRPAPLQPVCPRDCPCPSCAPAPVFVTDPPAPVCPGVTAVGRLPVAACPPAADVYPSPLDRPPRA